MPRSERILVVDDDEPTRALFTKVLQHAGYDVQGAADGVIALSMIENACPDLVLLDIQMPGLSGIEVLTRIRNQHTARELPVIMGTANQDDEMLARALELGANDYIQKPFSSKVLTARVRTRLNVDRLESQPPKRTIEVDPSLQARVPIVPGVILDGRYVLEERIGRGGYGEIFRAHHLVLERQVAIKLLRGDQGPAPGSLEAFQREGVAACRVDHPNAVEIYDVGVTDDGIPFLVMEYLEGRTLREQLNAERVEPLRAVDTMLPIAFVLTSAHANGIIHRDIKPENIFIHRPHGLQHLGLGHDGFERQGFERQGFERQGFEIVKVLDFGLATFREDHAPDQERERKYIQGSPSYLAPERVAGLAHDGRADVYAAGCVLFELLCGRPPFVREDGESLVDLATAHITRLAPDVRNFNEDVPDALADLLAHTLEKKPDRRPQSSHFAVQLGDIRDALHSRRAASA